MCLVNKEEPRSILNALGPWMNFHSKVEVRKSKGQTRALMKRFYIGFLNVRILRLKRTMRKGKFHSQNEDKMDHYKQIMRESGLYILAMSEVRRDGSGEEDVGNDCIFAW